MCIYIYIYMYMITCIVLQYYNIIAYDSIIGYTCRLL